MASLSSSSGPNWPEPEKGAPATASSVRETLANTMPCPGSTTFQPKRGPSE